MPSSRWGPPSQYYSYNQNNSQQQQQHRQQQQQNQQYENHHDNDQQYNREHQYQHQRQPHQYHNQRQHQQQQQYDHRYTNDDNNNNHRSNPSSQPNEYSASSKKSAPLQESSSSSSATKVPDVSSFNTTSSMEPRYFVPPHLQPFDPTASSASKEPFIPFPDDEPDFELIDSIEWGPDDATIHDELAARPKKDKKFEDPCCCAVPDDPQIMTCNDLSCVMFACQEECRSNCAAGLQCGNKRIQRKQWKPLQVFSAGKKGKGLKVMEDCVKGDLIAEYVGRAINKNFLPRLFRRYAHERKLYIMALDNNIYIDARKRGGVARYINHSCEPNCVVERWKVRGILRAAIVARKDIPSGTELSFDYQWERKRGRAPTKCHCGAPTCRGTLEVPRSMEEVALERELSTHWSRPLIRRAGQEIVNRCIRLFSKETQEYYPADVTQYDDSTGKHLLMYRHDLEEVWEDLRAEDWMLLDEEAEEFIIKKKGIPSTWKKQSKKHSSTSSSSSLSPSSSPTKLTGEQQQQLLMGVTSLGQAQKNYVYVQTYIKEALYARNVIERCQNSCRVTISSHQFARPPLPVDENNPEDVEKYRALDKSLDGTVWKISIVGFDVAKAYGILEKNVMYLEKKVSEGGVGMLSGINKDGAGGEVGGGGSSTGIGSSLAGATSSSTVPSTEVVFPRLIVESVKRRLPAIRDKCRNVTINFIPSESKSKQFAKMSMEGPSTNDIEIAMEHVWTQLNQICNDHQQLIQKQQQSQQQQSSSHHYHHHHGGSNNSSNNNFNDPLPKTPAGIYKDLGFLGGELTPSEFHHLFEYEKTTTNTTTTDMMTTTTTTTMTIPSTMTSSFNIGGANTTTSNMTNNNKNNTNTNTTNGNTKSQDAKEDLTRWSPFFASFEASQRCAIWVQSDFDKGRIDSSNRIVSEATPSTPKKIYFGCPPKQLSKLWSLLKTRTREVARGVKYLYLGPDRLYQPSMMRNGGQFFDFIKSITNASVTIDSMTGDHLRIDGRVSSSTAITNNTATMTTASNPINLVDDVPSNGNIGNGISYNIVDGSHNINNNVGTTQKNNHHHHHENLFVPSNMSEGERAALAEELVKLQIELYRDHCIRQHDWIFGRDWTLAKRIFAQNNNNPNFINNHINNSSTKNGTSTGGIGTNNGTSGIGTSSSGTVGSSGNDGSLSPMGRSAGGGNSFLSSSSRTTSAPLDDPRTLTNACLEIAEIVSTLGLDGTIAAHASVILYRSITVGLQQRNQLSDSQLKIREALLACVFIANKAQKLTKWKRLDAVLEAAYKTFYPGVSFDPAKEEVLVWEEKVITAETEILACLEYDVFWRGFDWILSAATIGRCNGRGTTSSGSGGGGGNNTAAGGGMDAKMARYALTFSVSGPVLAAGSDLWLTYGAEYVFAAAAGFLDMDLIFLCSALSIIPFKVLQAAELISSSIKATGFTKKLKSHPLYKLGKKGLFDRLSQIKVTCVSIMSQGALDNILQKNTTEPSSTKFSESQYRYKIIGERNRSRRIFRGIAGPVIKDYILPALDGISAESKCSIFLEQHVATKYDNNHHYHMNNNNNGQLLFDIVLEGSWRSVTIASRLLEESYNGHPLGRWLDVRFTPDTQGTIQSKGHPGLLQMNKIETADGWAGTIQSQVSNQSAWGTRTGGKCCTPAKVKESDLRHGGLRWWIPPRYGPSPTGSICDMFLVNHRSQGGILEALANLAHAFQGSGSAAFSILTSAHTMKEAMTDDQQQSNNQLDRFVAVSLQRWPSEKVASREQKKSKSKDDKGDGRTGNSSSAVDIFGIGTTTTTTSSSSSNKKPKESSMRIGFSAAALQEMQLLCQLHGLIQSPQGHPNFILPIGVALPSETDNGELPLPPVRSMSLDMKRIDEDIFSLTRNSLENEVAAERERKRKDMVAGPHLIFQPTPFILQRFLIRKKKRDDNNSNNPQGNSNSISLKIVGSWFHDLLSAVVHCHTNNIVLRSLQPDQIVVDHSGVVKVGGLYRATALSPEDLSADIYQQAKSAAAARKKQRSDDDNGEILKDPYVAPEMLLGSPKHGKETDIWMLGCLFAHMLVGKPIFSGKDRQSLLTAMYKMVGIPSTENFQQGTKFPYYKKPSKKYRPGVERALNHMLKDDARSVAGEIGLIGQMLRLDPKKRLTALEALQHPCMQYYAEQSASSEEFRMSFAQDWMSLKEQLMQSGKTQEEEIKAKARGIKRKAMLMAASQKSTPGGEGGDGVSKKNKPTNDKTRYGDDDGDDDLYDIDDL